MKIIIGAGGKKQEGWISTEKEQLDVIKGSSFCHYIDDSGGFEAILAEHVFEHLTMDELQVALKNCYEYLAPKGRLRIAVPDGFNPDPEYINYVSPPSSGHKILLNCILLNGLLREIGFKVELLEWFDGYGVFHARLWYEEDGYIERCLSNDPRNMDGKPHYTSLIVDAIKDVEMKPNFEKALQFIEEVDPNRVSVFNRRKATTLYELGRLAPAGGSIVELGCYHGVGIVPLWYGTRDGHRCKVIAVDAFADMVGWAGEPYGAKDKEVYLKNMKFANIKPKLIEGDARELVKIWKEPISLLVHDLAVRNMMPKDVMDWEVHVIKGGLIAMRDIDDYSMGTEDAVKNLLSTGRWGNRRDWDAFYTSLERL